MQAKITHENTRDARVVLLPTQYDGLVQRIRDLFQVDPVVLSYRDEDGDNVIFSSQEEYAIALAQDETGKMKIAFTSAAPAAPAAASAPAAPRGSANVTNNNITSVAAAGADANPAVAPTPAKTASAPPAASAGTASPSMAPAAATATGTGEFDKTWHLVNNTAVVWPAGMRLAVPHRRQAAMAHNHFAALPELLSADTLAHPVNARPVAPGESLDIAVRGVVPLVPGQYSAKYILVHPTDAESGADAGNNDNNSGHGGMMGAVPNRVFFPFNLHHGHGHRGRGHGHGHHGHGERIGRPLWIDVVVTADYTVVVMNDDDAAAAAAPSNNNWGGGHGWGHSHSHPHPHPHPHLHAGHQGQGCSWGQGSAGGCGGGHHGFAHGRHGQRGHSHGFGFGFGHPHAQCQHSPFYPQQQQQQVQSQSHPQVQSHPHQLHPVGGGCGLGQHMKANGVEKCARREMQERIAAAKKDNNVDELVAILVSLGFADVAANRELLDKNDNKVRKVIKILNHQQQQQQHEQHWPHQQHQQQPQ